MQWYLEDYNKTTGSRLVFKLNLITVYPESVDMRFLILSVLGGRLPEISTVRI